MSEHLDSIAQFELRGLLGEGGMGRVYRAWDRRLQRPAALKFLRSEDPRVAERLSLEARLQASLDHPHVCKVYDTGEWEGKPYIVLQLIEGRSLEELAPRLDLPQKLELMAQVAEAVHEAHRRGLVHRDLKPANILVEEGREGALHAFVTDFGLARLGESSGLTQEGYAPGTLPYMAPEQLAGSGPLDFRSDIYSLGATLYALVTGHPPFSEGADPALPSGLSRWLNFGDAAGQRLSLIQRVLDETPRPLGAEAKELPRGLEQLVQLCLEKRPAHRLPSARALAEDLRRILRGEPIQARPLPRAERAALWLQRHRGLALAAAAALVAAGLSGAYALRASWRAQRLAALGAEMGGLAKEMESGMRMARLSPIHDLAPDKTKVRDEMARIQARAAELGSASEGPVRYALGRGHLALREYKAAEADLRLAQKAGFRSPDFPLALGQVLAERYRQEHIDAKNIQDPVRRKAALDAVDRDYRRPAIEALRSYLGGHPEQKDFLDAYIAYIDGRNEEARAALHEVAAREPGLYEAPLLEGDALLELSRAAMGEGRLDEALKLTQQAIARHRAAVDVGRSDANLWAFLAKDYAQALQLSDILHLPMELPPEAYAAADAALRVDREEQRSYLSKVDLLDVEADHRQRNGQDSSAQIDAAYALAREACALPTADNLPFERLSEALNSRVTLIEAHSGDTGPTAEEGLRAAQEAERRAPESFVAHYMAGAMALYLAQAQVRAGADPRPIMASSTFPEMGRALELGSDKPLSTLALAQLHQWLGTYEQGHGLPWEAEDRASTAAYEEGLRLSPQNGTIQLTYAVALARAADSDRARGLDPAPRLARLRQLAAAASPETRKAMASLLLLADTVELRWAEAQGRGAPEALAQGQQLAAELQPGAAKDADSAMALGLWQLALADRGPAGAPAALAKAQAFFQAMDRLGRSSDALYPEALSLCRLGRPGPALACLDRLDQLDRGQQLPRWLRGLAELQLARSASGVEAARHRDAARQLLPKEAPPGARAEFGSLWPGSSELSR